jgi:DNA-binding CsgD family transcriptional regulator
MERPGHIPGEDGLGILSPAERRVLEFVRAGTLDAEIAVRLGVPVGDVKDRIASMLRKLNLPDKAALAAWTPSDLAPAATNGVEPPPLATRPEELEPAPVHEGLTWRLSLGTIASLVVIVVAAVGALGFLLWPKDADEPARAGIDNEDVPPLGGPMLPAPSPTPGDTPFPLLQVGDPIALPLDVALLYAEAGSSCDGPGCAGGIVRLHRSWQRGDEWRDDVIFAAGDGEVLQGLAASDDGRTIVVGLCKGDCGASGLSSRVVQVHLSVDGGNSWRHVGDLPGNYAVHDLLPGGEGAIVQPSLVPGVDANPIQIYSFADQALAESGIHGAPVSGGRYVISSDRTLLLDAKGNPIEVPGLGDQDVIYAIERQWGAQGGLFVAFGQLGNPRYVSLAWLPDVGKPRVWSTNVFSGSYLSIERDLVLGMMNSRPMLFALDAGWAYPVDGPFNAVPTGPLVMLGVQRGYFAQVQGAGDCLYIRREPTTSSEPLGCYPDGALFTRPEPPGRGNQPFIVTAEGLWLPVFTPDGGQSGFASTEYLLYDGLRTREENQ